MTEVKPPNMPSWNEVYDFAKSNPYAFWKTAEDVFKLGNEDKAEMSGGRLRELWKLNGGSVMRDGKAWIEIDLLPKLLRAIIDANDQLRSSPATVAESELREDQEALDGVNAHEHWGVSVDTHGDDLVRIETAMLAGKADLSEQDLATIRTAARHLLSFAGPSRLRPTPQTEKP